MHVFVDSKAMNSKVMPTCSELQVANNENQTDKMEGSWEIKNMAGRKGLTASISVSKIIDLLTLIKAQLGLFN